METVKEINHVPSKKLSKIDCLNQLQISLPKWNVELRHDELRLNGYFRFGSKTLAQNYADELKTISQPGNIDVVVQESTSKLQVPVSIRFADSNIPIARITELATSIEQKYTATHKLVAA